MNRGSKEVILAIGYDFHPGRRRNEAKVQMRHICHYCPFHTHFNERTCINAAPYAWLVGLNGTVATLPGLPPADIDIDLLDDIAGNINEALFLIRESKKGRWGLFVDIQASMR